VPPQAVDREDGARGRQATAEQHDAAEEVDHPVDADAQAAAGRLPEEVPHCGLGVGRAHLGHRVEQREDEEPARDRRHHSGDGDLSGTDRLLPVGRRAHETTPMPSIPPRIPT
jgi:hypothetical protein